MDGQRMQEGRTKVPQTDEQTWWDIEYAIRHRAVSFEQFAYVHLARREAFEDRPAYRKLAERYYYATIEAFCKEHGEIVDSFERYWPKEWQGAVFAVLTTKDELWLRYFRPRSWPADRKAAELLVEIETLLARCQTRTREALDIFPPGATRNRHLGRVFEITYSVLALLDDLFNAIRSPQPPNNAPQPLALTDRIAAFQNSYRSLWTRFENLPRTDDDTGEYAVLALREARFKFFEGMLSTFRVLLLAVVVLTVAWSFAPRIWLFFHSLSPSSNAAPPIPAPLGEWLPALEFALPCIAGGIGAILSVLTRVQNNTFKLDWRLGWEQNEMLGRFRPLIGSLAAVALVIFLKAGLLNLALPIPAAANTAQSSDATKDATFFKLYWYIGLAFLAGFSERFAHIVVSQAEGNTTGPNGTGLNDDKSPASQNPTQNLTARPAGELAITIDRNGNHRTRSRGSQGRWRPALAKAPHHPRS